MSRMLGLLREVKLLRYLLASIAALAADMSCFLVLLSSGAMAVMASAFGYCTGILVHWLLSSRTVFVGDVAACGPKRTEQKAMFVLSALAGLALTMAIVGLAERLAIDPRPAKLLAVIASFILTWVLRNRIIFRATL